MRVGLVTLRKTGAIALFNTAAEQILGYRALEVRGRPCGEIFSGLPDMLSNLRSKRPGSQRETRLATTARHKDGREVAVIATAHLTLDNDDAAAGNETVIVFQEAQEAAEPGDQRGSCPCGRVRHLDRLLALDKFAAGIVHEIRNPLTGISTNAQHMLERVGRSGPFHEELQDILADVKDIEGIVSKVLDFARPGKLRLCEVPVEGIVKEVLRFSKMPLRRQNVRLHVDLKAPAARVKVDVPQMKQVFFNVVRNACDAMPRGGELRVSTARPAGSDGLIRVEVEDTGEGIAERDLGCIFDPFFSTRREGTGLGLAISRKIVEEHGGQIEVQSKRGQGARFAIVLPTV